MKFSVGVEYAIHSLVYMVEYREKQSISIIDLAAFNNISESYLSKVFTKLSKAQLIKSVPGVKGGYMLNMPPENISFWDVIIAIEGNESFFKCKEIRQNNAISSANNLTSCDFTKPCLIKSVMIEAQMQMQKYLENKSILWLKDNVYQDVYNQEDISLIEQYFKK